MKIVPIKTRLANRGNYGAVRNLNKICWIVIHYTANDGDRDESNGNYFANNIVKASAHYFVDSDSITQSVPDNYVAWSVGGDKYSSCATTGGGKNYKQCTNTNSISIELCDDKKNGSIYPSTATIANALELTEALRQRFNVPKERVIRHFDVVGKLCPIYWCGTAAKDSLWRTEFWDKLEEDDMTQERFNELMDGYLKSLQDNDCASWSEDGRKYVIENGLFVGSGTLPTGEPNYMWHSFLNREQISLVLKRFADLYGLEKK